MYGAATLTWVKLLLPLLQVRAALPWQLVWVQSLHTRAWCLHHPLPDSPLHKLPWGTSWQMQAQEGKRVGGHVSPREAPLMGLTLRLMVWR